MTQQTRSERFGLVLSTEERATLQALADREHLSAAAVLRRLLWREAAQQLPQLTTTEVKR